MKIIYYKKKANECDGASSPATVQYDGMPPMGMGDANPLGGPDRWDTGFAPSSFSTKRRYKIRKRKRK